MRFLSLARLCLALGAATVAAASLAQGSATPYPTKPITLVVPYPAGGVADQTARLVGQKLQDSLHQPVVVDNRTGAGGMVGARAVARAPADGYTILLGVSGLVLQPLLVQTATVDPFKELAPITLIARLPLLLAVPKSGPPSLEEFVRQAKADPRRFSIGNYGVGTPSHLLGIMLNQQAGMDLPLIAFQGSAPLATNLIGEQVSAGFIDSVTARQFGEKFRFLAVTGTRRLPGLPELRNFRELGYRSFEQDGWLGVLAPAGTPKPIIAKLSSELAKIIATPEVAAKIESMGISPVGSTPEELLTVMRNDADVYGKVIRSANIQLN
ncbi:Tripartite-type tricarboxylate transporter, receptor component TctC [Variovorax sp. HW608]|uniref:Bug family tripartite tricarboxylate transporter substrate binding protein n=1 Tax=Variovorax sp. HW608 TaxID=1034889 RepID=UPI00081F8D82|nr:tripartite tricarboxylate transporter substrate binding protein [Variovorax sp. HW608]SCK43107.1 Tripartite-type tricarboxylate transporter, receptor component TctC [Variovorax sp. HW608]